MTETEEPGPNAAPQRRKSVRKLAAGIADSYRTLDPIVAQVWAQPGVPPYAPETEETEPEE